MATSTVESSMRLPAESLLGGTEALLEEPHSPLEWVELIRRGIPSGVVDALAASTRLTQAELAAALGIPARTLVRRKREGTLSSEESAKLVRLARVVERATEVFEDLDASLDWLKTENAALSGVTPLSLVDTDIGAETILDTLGRIEHGVFG